MAKAATAVNVTADLNKAFEQANELLDSFADNGAGHNADPDQFTKSTVEHFTSLGENVMCIHNRQVLFSGDSRVKHRNIEVSTSWVTTKGFSVYVAPKGVTWTVTNTGDGGYINWAFGGDFTRSGANNQVVTFH